MDKLKCKHEVQEGSIQQGWVRRICTKLLLQSTFGKFMSCFARTLALLGPTLARLELTKNLPFYRQ